ISTDPKSWLPIAEAGDLGIGVLALFGGYDPINQFLPPWQIVVMHLASSDGTRLFRQAEHILPKALEKRSIPDGAIAQLRQKLAELNWPNNHIDAFVEHTHFLS